MSADTEVPAALADQEGLSAPVRPATAAVVAPASASSEPAVPPAVPPLSPIEPATVVEAPRPDIDYDLPAPEPVKSFVPSNSSVPVPELNGNANSTVPEALAGLELLRTALLAARTRVEQAEAAAEELSAQATRFHGQLTEAQSRLTSARTVQQQTVDALQAANSQVVKGNEGAQQAQQAAEAVRSQLSTALAQVEAKNTEVVNLQAELAQAKDQAHNAQKETESVKQALQVALNDVEHEQANVAEAQKATGEEKAKVATLTTTNTMLKVEVADLQQEKIQQAAQLERLHAEYDALHDRLLHPDLVEALKAKGTDGVSSLYESNPALAAAVNKTRDLLLPSLAQSREAGGIMLNQTHEKIADLAKPFVGETYVPMVAGLLVYGLVFIPLFLSFWCLASVQARLKLRPLLSFCHLYFALVLLVCAGAAVALGMDPLKSFQEQDASTYLFVQGIMALLFILYEGMLCTAFLFARNNAEWVVRLVQIASTLSMASVYYRLVWEPSMLDKTPETLLEENLWLPYLIGAGGFGVVILLERVQRQRVAEDPTVRTNADDDTFRITVDVSETQGAGEDSHKQE